MYLRCIFNPLFSSFLFFSNELKTHFERVIRDAFSRSSSPIMVIGDGCLSTHHVSNNGHWRCVFVIPHLWCGDAEIRVTHVIHICDKKIVLRIFSVSNETWAASPMHEEFGIVWWAVDGWRCIARARFAWPGEKEDAYERCQHARSRPAEPGHCWVMAGRQVVGCMSATNRRWVRVGVRYDHVYTAIYIFFGSDDCCKLKPAVVARFQ